MFHRSHSVYYDDVVRMPSVHMDRVAQSRAGFLLL